MRRVFGTIMTVGILWASSPTAHEFWIDPVEFRVEEGEPLQAALRVGQKFKGSSSPFVPVNFQRFDLIAGDKTIAVQGRIGDRPALNMSIAETGLVTVVHVTRSYTLTYTDWEKFGNFAQHKDFTWALDAHVENGWPMDRFKEDYVRYGKSLMAVDSTVGADQQVGLEVEIVALANPYADDISKGLPLQVFYHGAPVPDAQVELFEQDADGSVEIRLYDTDAAGIAKVDVSPGHRYLADHVVLRAVDPASRDSGAYWESLWASLTFEVPL